MATLKRNDLYADVWSRPATTIAAELGLPRNTLKRICAGMDIEFPMAVVILGGLVTLSLLNVFLLPVLYARFARGSATSEHLASIT